ncbi:MAG: Bug family tripartite tricarboxylate transporter substrate binding protein [Pigmentiphaga sp.]
MKLLRHAVIGALLALPMLAAAQNYPNKPIRLVVPWPPGTPPDVLGRVVSERMSAGLGQPVIVENKPGAAGVIGLGEVLRNPADGYTAYLMSSASLVAPLLFPTQNINFAKSLSPVGMVAWSYNVLVAPVDSPLTSATKVVESARAQPGRLSFASGGNGSPAHLAGELLNQKAGIDTLHVPYNQFSQAVGDLLAGRVDYMFLTASAALAHIEGGKLRPLAVTAPKRLPALPETGNMIEQGFNDFALNSFDGIAVKAGTPQPIIDRLNTELNRALSDPGVRERLGTFALEPQAMTPQEFGEVLAAGSEQWLAIGRKANIQAD